MEVLPKDYLVELLKLNDVFKMAGFEDEEEDEDAAVRPSQMWVPVRGGQWAMEGRFDVATDDLGWPMLRNGAPSWR